jgi:hypothetical protein
MLRAMLAQKVPKETVQAVGLRLLSRSAASRWVIECELYKNLARLIASSL